MEVVTKGTLELQKALMFKKIREGIFVYPTDTIYGIGCNAENGVLIDKIRALKGRQDMPFSVIAPSKNWIREHCVVSEREEEWLAKLPGPYTLIFKVKTPEKLPLSLNGGRDTLGVRIPNHWISNVVAELGIPVVTTSANRSGGNVIRTIEDLPSDWKEEVSVAIDEGENKGHASTLVHLYNGLKVEER